KPASSFNNQWGLPLTLLRLGAEHGAAIVELGTNQAGEIATLSAIARPTAGIAVLNADDPRVASMAREAKGRVVTFGRAARATVRIAGEATDTEAGFAFTLEA